MNDDAPKKAPAGWLDALAVSEAELVAGLTIPLEKILQEFDEEMRKFDATRKQARRPRRSAID
jgi:hypothetical protein